MKRYLVLILAILLVSCSNANSATIAPLPSQPTPGQSSPSGELGYPAPTVSSEESGYPSPTSIYPKELPKDPAPSSNQVAQITGKLVHDNKALAGNYPNVYLAEIKFDDKGNPMIASLDRTTAPKAMLDSSGNFRLVNIKPGKYVLMVDLVGKFLMLNDENGKEKIIIPEAGKVMSLGNISIP